MKAISVDTMRGLDARTIENGTPGFVLMERAGVGACRAMLEFLEHRFHPQHRREFIVVAGKGNNGGDAYVVARCLAERGLTVRVCAVCPRTELKGDARAHAFQLPDTVPHDVVEALPAWALRHGCVLVDGLLGTGISGSLRPPYDHLIEQMNDSGLPVVAIDIPSGLNGDSGEPAGDAVNACLTVTMAQPKKGLLTGEGLRRCGALRCVDIGIDPADVEEVDGWTAGATMMADARGLIERRPSDGHKGTFGSVLVAGGSAWYTGAPFLSAEGALRSGAGLVTVAIPQNCAPLCHVGASLIVRRVPDREGFFNDSSVDIIRSLAEDATAAVYGPGTGPAEDAAAVLRALVEQRLPLVVDADGLRRLAEHPDLARHAEAPLILTPHPGEMRVLLRGFGCEDCLDAGRLDQARALAEAAGAVTVLKGLGTVVAAADGRMTINTSGSAALATAGTGDVLAGMLGALLAQNMDPWKAAVLGTFAHGFAAECLPGPERALTADQLVEALSAAWWRLSPAS